MAKNAPVLWAQRRDTIYLRVEVPDIDEKSASIDLTEDVLKVTCESKGEKYATEIPFWAKVDPKESKFSVKPRGIEFILKRAEEGDYWDKLMNIDGRKPHWLSCDWDKWVDEDESDDEGFDDQGMGGMGDMDMASMMGGGMPGMGGMGGAGGMPDLSAMMAGMGGGEGGMPDFSSMMGGMGGEGGDDDMPALDDDMPSLEDDMPPLEDDQKDDGIEKVD